jgi:hypothetical protein
LSDTKYICWVGDWWVFFPFAIITLAVFGGGVIILFAYIACNRKKALTSRTFNARFRFLFIRFRDERIYWEVIIILRKLAISCAVIFFSGGQSEMLVVLFSMLVIFIAFILQTHNYPFRRSFHNIMEYCVLLSTEFLLFCALLFYVDEFPDEWNKPALGYLCIISVVGSSLLIVFLMLLDFISQWREDRAQRKKELELINNMVAQSEDPLFKFKEKRRQATAIVEIKDDDKDKFEEPTQQPTKLVQEQTLQNTLVDLDHQPKNHVHMPDVPHFVPQEEHFVPETKNESLLHDVPQHHQEVEVPSFNPTVNEQFTGYEDGPEDEVVQIQTVNKDEKQSFAVGEVEE